MNYLGIDVSKSTSRCIILDHEGEKLRKGFTIRNNAEEFNKLVDKLKDSGLSPDNLLAGIEATGIWWENLYSHLTENGYKVIVLNPHQTNKYREALRIKAKTDDLDAYVIAGLLRSKMYAKSFIPEELIQVLREFTKLRYHLIKDKKNYKRKIYSILALIFPEYRKTVLKNPFGIAAIQILKRFPTAKHLQNAKPKQVEKIVRSIQGNNVSINDIMNLINTAKQSIYSGRAKEARATNLRILLTHYSKLDESISELDNNIQEILSPNSNDNNDSFPGANLLTIPGVGKKTVAAILSVAGADGKSYASGKKLIGYMGFFPKIFESGETKKENVISKRGPRYFRWAMYMAAVAGIKHNNEFKAIYNRKISQGKTKKQALVYLAKKITQMCLSMLKSGEEYRPERVFMPA